MSERRYLNECLSSSKYPQGQWYVMEAGGKLLSSLIVYRTGFDLPPGCWGIGSVATPPAARRRGYAAGLVEHVIADARAREARGLYLFSGIGTDYYGKFGFQRVEATQPEGQDPCMVLAFRDQQELRGAVPGFF
jgi:N-acetylglutamate synthase-like GNAT family acetyltransferase